MNRRVFLRSFLFILLVLFAGRTSAAPIDLSIYSAPVKVACIGDSITFGARIAGDRMVLSYPAQLGTMLGPQWEVRNFGRNSATLLNLGNLPYQKQPQFQAALQFNPDVVVIMLGTNDTKPRNWALKDAFVSDYEDLIAKFQALPGKPRIFIAYPIAVGPAGKYGITDAGVKAEQPLLAAIAKATGATLIDLYTPTAGRLDLYNPDQVHPLAAGATVIAQNVYQALIGHVYSGTTQ